MVPASWVQRRRRLGWVSFCSVAFAVCDRDIDPVTGGEGSLCTLLFIVLSVPSDRLLSIKNISVFAQGTPFVRPLCARERFNLIGLARTFISFLLLLLWSFAD